MNDPQTISMWNGSALWTTDNLIHSPVVGTNTTSTIIINPRSAFSSLLHTISSALWMGAPPVLLLLGSVGNGMIVLLMRSLLRSSSSSSSSSSSNACLSVYFSALALSDQCLLFVSSLWNWVRESFSWPHRFFRYDLLCTVPFFVFYTCALTSAWFLVVMTYQRVTSVVVPMRVGVLCTVSRGKVIVAGVVIAACAFNLHLVETFRYDREFRECVPREKHTEFVHLFTLLDLFGASVIPFALLLLGNSVLIAHVIKSFALSRQMRRGGSSKDTLAESTKVYPMTVTLILTSAAFLVLTLPVCMFHTYTGRALDSGNLSDDFQAVLNLVGTVVHFLWSIASASNFYLYLLSGSKFRQETKRLLNCRKN